MHSACSEVRSKTNYTIQLNATKHTHIWLPDGHKLAGSHVSSPACGNSAAATDLPVSSPAAATVPLLVIVARLPIFIVGNALGCSDNREHLLHLLRLVLVGKPASIVRLCLLDDEVRERVAVAVIGQVAILLPDVRPE